MANSNTGLGVKVWMITQKVKSTEIARNYGCDESFISHFLKGNRCSKALADYFIKQGCPEKFFKDGKVVA